MSKIERTFSALGREEILKSDENATYRDLLKQFKEETGLDVNNLEIYDGVVKVENLDEVASDNVNLVKKRHQSNEFSK